jgi:hypothetical protein
MARQFEVGCEQDSEGYLVATVPVLRGVEFVVVSAASERCA